MRLSVEVEGRRHEYTIRQGVTVIGRSHACDITIPHPSLSRQHLQVEFVQGRVIVRDLGSRNGTFHDEKRLTEAEVGTGSVVRAGRVVLRFLREGEFLPRPAPPVAASPEPPPPPVAPAPAEPIAVADELDAVVPNAPGFHADEEPTPVDDSFGSRSAMASN